MTPALSDLLRELLLGRVEFVLAGGLAAVAQGAPVTTFDVDIVHRRTPDNVERLLGVLGRLHAVVRDLADRRLPPDKEALLGPGHNLFVTDLGPLDCLGAIEGGLDYDALMPRSVPLRLGDKTLHAVSLAALVELKEQWTDDESKLRAAILRRTLKAQE